MITTSIAAGREWMRRHPIVWRIGRRLGINQLIRLFNDRVALSQGQYRVRVMGRLLNFAVASRREISRIDGVHEEKELLDRLLAALRPGDVFFDVGANIGMITLLAATSSEIQLRAVHAFEPEPRTAAQLRRNIELNNLDSLVTVHEVALSDTRGLVHLAVSGEIGAGTHSILQSRSGPRVEVQCQTADSFATQVKEHPTIVKIDVEGAEYAVLSGMRGLLQSGEIHDLLIELHPAELAESGRSVEAVDRFLYDVGYEAVWTQERHRQRHAHYRRRS